MYRSAKNSAQYSRLVSITMSQTQMHRILGYRIFMSKIKLMFSPLYFANLTYKILRSMSYI